MALDIIGAGFGRTGTLSLKTALEQLGFGPCYHMIECFPRGDTHFPLWEAARRGEPVWDELFDGFRSTVDFPAATSWRELAEYYPQAKVILSVRDPERWFESTQDTIFGPEWMEWLKGSAGAGFIKATINDYFDGRMHDKDHLVARFNEHVAAVKAALSPERLLVFEAKDGWQPLCEFLGVPVPEGDYPHVNDTEATKQIIAALMEHGFANVFEWGKTLKQ
jgi:hypothetical protein